MSWQSILTRRCLLSHCLKSTLVALASLFCGLESSIADTPFDVNVQVHFDQPIGELRPIWNYFGADEPNYAYMKDGKKLLGQLGELAPKSVFFRTHNLLTTGPGTPALKWGSTNAYTEDAEGKPIYDWKIVDLIFDTYLANGVKPYVQIGFMPKALSTKPDPYEHTWRPGLPYNDIYTGWAYPPRDYAKWEELAFQWTKHCVERYGQTEVESWYWETWNEANIGYWKGTPEEFRKTHDFAVAGVLRALPTAKVGGSDTAGDGGNFARDFYRHCLRETNYATGEKGTKLDFVSFHAKGAPNWVENHIQMGISTHLKTIDAGFRLINEFEELKGKPIIIGESDPEGCAACQGDRFRYRNSTMYSSYTAASFVRKLDLAQRHNVNLEGALTWAFTFEDQPYFAGFRQLASNGIALPVLNVFRMFSKLGNERVAATSDQQRSLDETIQTGIRADPDVGVLASRTPNSMSILLWHYHDDDMPSDDAMINLTIDGLPSSLASAKLQRFLVDQNHSNAYTTWLHMGSPIAPNVTQYEALQKSSNLASVDEANVSLDNGLFSSRLNLKRQGVSLLLLKW